MNRKKGNADGLTVALRKGTRVSAPLRQERQHECTGSPSGTTPTKRHASERHARTDVALLPSTFSPQPPRGCVCVSPTQYPSSSPRVARAPGCPGVRHRPPRDQRPEASRVSAPPAAVFGDQRAVRHRPPRGMKPSTTLTVSDDWRVSSSTSEGCGGTKSAARRKSDPRQKGAVKGTKPP